MTEEKSLAAVMVDQGFDILKFFENVYGGVNRLAPVRAVVSQNSEVVLQPGGQLTGTPKSCVLRAPE